MTMHPQAEQAWAVVQAMMEAYCERDVDATCAFFADTEELVSIGAGSHARCMGFAQLRAHLEQDLADADPISAEFPWRHVSTRGEMAWAAAEVHFRIPYSGGLRVAARLTAVLIRHQGAWRIVHSHLSMPFPPED